MGYHKPLPEPDGDRKPFWEGCREHRLRFQQCEACGHVRWPPAIICPQCHSRQTVWIESSGRGRVYTYTVYHQAFQQAFKDDLPYVVAVVALTEGPHLLTNIVGCSHEAVTCDMPVTVAWEDVTDAVSLPKFRPLDAP
ncbi:MAG: Zn-ribbon domain-containing OB-fold protein [Deltaproteobacteria bacterium]|jgi:uncharacterized protein|nr:Zn-ribbon domain-containing OB-fold protein [Deltaproteobacteria bacterium]